MILDSEEQLAGRQWFWGAGAAAVLLCLFLAYLDYQLSSSSREQDLGRSLRELRSAQSALSSGMSDPRE